jgi:hypothetical protein
MRIICLVFVVLISFNKTFAQNNPKAGNLVYVDKQGVLRWSKNNAEASFFGVNYTTPFAYAYRAHKVLGVDIENAIRQDVYHLARLGLDAFRVHVWDTEITDADGNLIDNDHLRLFDFLLAELKKRNIKTIVTPIAFWGNGYPEQDERTTGFSRVYGKGRATSNDTAIRAQENYLQQFFRHVNPYTKLTYIGDPDVIAVELNNEPSHSGPKSTVTNYINRLSAAVKSVGWTKPIYYNISQSPFYADAVAASDVNGYSFQWYPSGLVANQEQKGNYLPNVDKYSIPYDTIPAFKNKSLMVYEFDAADLLQSNMYPAMARSFREAGFQWATQFAYDPLALAYANTEYQTHYLNLAYTPSKAISMMIAAEVFRRMPRLKNYGAYPADSSFDAFRVSYKNKLSEMNTEQKFYYSNTTQTKPVSSSKLTNIAGVGSSAVVRYEGLGAYFLDKLEDGAWRLELMPDAVYMRDPFERASPQKEVTRIQWATHAMEIVLPDLGQGFTVKGINEGNNYSPVASGAAFEARPGTYLLTRTGKQNVSQKNTSAIGLNEFVAPQAFSNEMFLQHDPLAELSAGKPFSITAKVVGLDTGRIWLQVNRLGGGGQGGQGRMIPMIRKGAADVMAEIPAELMVAGQLSYRIIMQKGNDYAVFPGNIKSSPFAWNNYQNETWKTFIAAANGRMEIFNATTERNARVYPGFRRNFQTSYVTGEIPGQLILRLASTSLSGDHTMGFQVFFAEKLKGRQSETADKTRLFIRGRSGTDQPVKVKVTLTNEDAVAVSTYITLNNTFSDVEVPLNNLMQDASLLLPRPYPGFMALWFKGSGNSAGFRLREAEKIELTIGSDLPAAEWNKQYSMEVSTIWMQ